MEKQQYHSGSQIEFGDMINMIKSFSISCHKESLWNEIGKILWSIERGRRKSKQHFFTYKKLPYFCKRIDAYLEENDNKRLEYSTILSERFLIGLKIQMVLHPVLLEKIGKMSQEFSHEKEVTGNRISRWELTRRDSQELAYFIKKNFGKNSVEISFLKELKHEVQEFLEERRILFLNRHQSIFKRSPDGKHCYFYQADEATKWRIMNEELFETGINYEDAFLPLQLEESLYKPHTLRFSNLYKILYPKTRSSMIVVRINDVISELEDIQGLLNKRKLY
ncbi:hypothetical protein MTBBW1_350019 [Desulfamplus magnetovallimortis]|uniref:Uncharacterized protein n=1 Tax=Desulfamplus magnetovallimortis TaxID=1246637 RepID=A0A1W1HGL5_9BACT|nr:hypothetical protein [Desulfamplus magnetovallimortis]SLM31528.1 hypothetical protein MTBBW1_350019 [Desulfamplus magnetovallimortis]